MYTQTLSLAIFNNYQLHEIGSWKMTVVNLKLIIANDCKQRIFLTAISSKRTGQLISRRY